MLYVIPHGGRSDAAAKLVANLARNPFWVRDRLYAMGIPCVHVKCTQWRDQGHVLPWDET